ncbi:hypothetical protein [Sulfurimonas sp.]
MQYTRTDGLVNALKKIGGHKKYSYIFNKEARIYSHIYFSNAVKSSFFETHPALEKRIKRLDPQWDGEYITTSKPITHNNSFDVVAEEEYTQFQKQNIFKKELLESLAVVSVLEELEHIGQPSNVHVKKAHEVLSAIPTTLLSMTKEPFSAQAIILALISKQVNEVPAQRHSALEKRHEALYQEVQKARIELNILPEEYYLHLIQICLPVLKSMSKLQYTYFKELFLDWVYANEKLSLFEWSLKHLILYPLDIAFGNDTIKREKYRSIGAVKQELEVFLSILALSHTKDKEKAKELFDKAKLSVDINNNLNFIVHQDFSKSHYEILDQVIEKIQQSKIMLRKKIFIMAVMCLSESEKISPQNTKVLYAIASTFGLPLLLRLDEI